MISLRLTERVKKVAQEMGYVVNGAARTLGAGRSGDVGLCLPTLTNERLNAVAEGITQRAFRLGYRVQISLFYGIGRLEVDAVQRFMERRVEGLIVLEPVLPYWYLKVRPGYFLPIIMLGQNVDLGNVGHDEGSEILEVLHWRIVAGSPPYSVILLRNRRQTPL